jgi:hypothetical protein
MKSPLKILLALTLLCLPARAQEAAEKVKIKPKGDDDSSTSSSRLLEPEVSLIDVPTAAVLDYGGFSTQTRFFAQGGVLERADFGVYNRLNIGASLNVDKLIGNDKPTRVRAPNVNVKYRFYDGEQWIPALAVGFDGQGYDYNPFGKRYNNRHRGFFVVATQEVGVPGLLLHPSFNISDFDSNSIFASIPASFNIRDRVSLMFEWDNINNFVNSRINVGARFFVTGGLHIDFALRALGQGGFYSDNTPRGPERIVQIRYSGNF